MKLQTILPALLLFVGGNAVAQNTVSVKGQVLGNTDSCMVALADAENPQNVKRIASAKFKGESFAFSAEFKKTPCLVNLNFFTKGNKDKWMKVTELQLMTDGSPISVKIDKDLMLADMSSKKKQGLANKSDGKLTIESGKAQRQMDEYLDYMRAAMITADSASYAEAMAWFDNAGIDDSIKDFKERADAAKAIREVKHNEFIAAHPDYPVTAALVAQYAYLPFTYSQELFDKQYASLANNPDTTHVNFIKRNLDYFRSHANGASYTDFIGEDKSGKNVSLSSLMKSGKLMLIDFWASWCGPCREAIPKVKEMAKEYAEKLEVVSCSVDEKKDKWLKAETEENMPWMQLWLPMSKLEKAATAYSITSIPRLVLIGADGKVICITHNPETIRQSIAQAIK
mgnify:FL=1